MRLTRLLLGFAVAVALTPALTAGPASADNCSQTKPPLDAASKQVAHGNMLWVSRTGSVGVTAPAGTGVVQIPNAGPQPVQAMLIDAQGDGQQQLVVSNGRAAYLYVVSGCELTPVVDKQGQPFVFDLQNLAGNGTGIACLDLGAGRRLVALQALQNGPIWTVRRTEIDLDRTTATPGRSDTVPAISQTDPTVASALTISCGDLTMSKDGVQQP
jgi:hypothetical protein